MKTILVLVGCLISVAASYGQITKSDLDILNKVLTDPISVRASAAMGANLLARPALRDLALNKAFGGYFPAAVFEQRSDKTGVLLWYCYNPDYMQNRYPEFFMALEHIKEFNPDMPPTTPGAEGGPIYFPRTYKYTATMQTTTDVEQFLITHLTNAPVPVATISAQEVQRFSEKFEYLIKALSLPERYVGYPFAYFEYRNNSPYETFMDRTPTYVRYYFGFIDNDQHKPNYFRPILAGAGSTGSTIRTSTAIDESFLQKSWPPPPNE